jgi:3-phenylpropionate/trans-cinnamate dioxygenase ferredoxin subunit
MKDAFVSCLKDSELAEGKMKAVQVKGRPILLARVAGQVYAVSNRCPHMSCQLQGGILNSYIVMCPCHGWKFDVRNGQYQENPQTALTSYRCKSEQGKILVEILK